MSPEHIFAVVFHFYGDPIDMTWGRTLNLFHLIREVQGEFRPKENLELGLLAAEELNRQEKIERAERKRSKEWQI